MSRLSLSRLTAVVHYNIDVVDERRGVLFDVQFYAAADGAQPLVDFLEALRTSSPALHALLVACLVKLKDGRFHGPP